MYKCKTAIVLMGKSDSGKTTTLRKVAERLVAMPDAAVKNSSRCLKFLGRSGADVSVVVEINGKVVVVRSCGDDEHELVCTLKMMERYICDVAIFAVSLPKRAGGTKAVHRYYIDHKVAIATSIVEVSKIRTEKIASIEAEAGRSADEILRILEKIIAE